MVRRWRDDDKHDPFRWTGFAGRVEIRPGPVIDEQGEGIRTGEWINEIKWAC